MNCPSCERKGKSVRVLTLQSLLVESALTRGVDLDGHRHCATRDCEVVYFKEAENVFFKRDLRVRVGTKERESPRPLCYCFGYSWESLEEESASGEVTIVQDITLRCKSGEDQCVERNPQGACCLGNIRRALRDINVQQGMPVDEPSLEKRAAQATDGQAAPKEEEDHECCGASKSSPDE